MVLASCHGIEMAFRNIPISHCTDSPVLCYRCKARGPILIQAHYTALGTKNM